MTVVSAVQEGPITDDALQGKERRIYLFPFLVWSMEMGRKNPLRNVLETLLSRLLDARDWCQSFYKGAS